MKYSVSTWITVPLWYDLRIKPYYVAPIYQIAHDKYQLGIILIWLQSCNLLKHSKVTKAMCTLFYTVVIHMYECKFLGIRCVSALSSIANIMSSICLFVWSCRHFSTPMKWIMTVTQTLVQWSGPWHISIVISQSLLRLHALVNDSFYKTPSNYTLSHCQSKLSVTLTILTQN